MEYFIDWSNSTTHTNSYPQISTVSYKANTCLMGHKSIFIYHIQICYASVEVYCITTLK